MKTKHLLDFYLTNRFFFIRTKYFLKNTFSLSEQIFHKSVASKTMRIIIFLKNSLHFFYGWEKKRSSSILQKFRPRFATLWILKHCRPMHISWYFKIFRLKSCQLARDITISLIKHRKNISVRICWLISSKIQLPNLTLWKKKINFSNTSSKNINKTKKKLKTLNLKWLFTTSGKTIVRLSNIIDTLHINNNLISTFFYWIIQVHCNIFKTPNRPNVWKF